ncbi:MAG: DUF3297 family protein [Sphingopyxis sp.]
MSDTPPDRLSINPRSPHFGGELLRRGVGIRFKGTQRHDVEEYCQSEGWIRVAAGRSLDRHGQAMTIKLSGPVEAWFEDVADEKGNDSTVEASESE